MKERLLEKLIANESTTMTKLTKKTGKGNLTMMTVTVRMRSGYAGVLSLKVVSVA